MSKMRRLNLSKDRPIVLRFKTRKHFIHWLRLVKLGIVDDLIETEEWIERKKLEINSLRPQSPFRRAKDDK